MLEDSARSQLIAFKDPNDAYEKRGYHNGIIRVVEVIRTIYADTHGATINNGPAQSESRESRDIIESGISAPSNPADDKPSGWSY